MKYNLKKYIGFENVLSKTPPHFIFFRNSPSEEIHILAKSIIITYISGTIEQTYTATRTKQSNLRFSIN